MAPYYDVDGNYLGNDENGFKGKIFITTKEAFVANSKDGVASSKTLQADKNTKTLKETRGLSAEAQSKIYTNVLQNMKDIDLSRLYNGKVSINMKSVYKDGKMQAEGYNDPDAYPRYGQGDGPNGSNKGYGIKQRIRK